jgi:hypothetical protein
MNIRRGPAPGEMLVKKSVAHLGPVVRGEGVSKNPWSALLMRRMLAQRKTPGNQEKSSSPVHGCGASNLALSESFDAFGISSVRE